MKNGIPVILCVGSDKIAGDALGPVVGELLTEVFKIKCFVYGTTSYSVNGKNLNEYLEVLKRAHADSPVIAVDACLSSLYGVGETLVIRGGVNPCRALTKTKNPVGDLGVLGVVDANSESPLSTLMSVSWVNVEKLCYKIAFSLYKVLSA